MNNPLKIEKWTERIFLALGIVFALTIVLNLLYPLELSRWYVGIVQIVIGLSLLIETAWRAFKRSTYSSLTQTKNVLYVVIGIVSMVTILFGILNLPVMVSMSLYNASGWLWVQVVDTILASIGLLIFMFLPTPRG